jgi:hypothetical protein
MWTSRLTPAQTARGAPARGAAALAWGLLFFACLQLTLALAMERWRPELRDPEYGAKRARLRARLREAPGHPLLVVVGSSRVNHGFRPDALPPLPPARAPRGGPPGTPVVFNSSVMGAGPLLQLLCLRRLLADGIRPDWVVLECWPPLWNGEGAQAEINRIPPARLEWRDLGVVAPYFPRPGRLHGEWGQARLAPWYSSRFVLLAQFARDLLPQQERRDDQWGQIDPWGWLPDDESTDPAAVEARFPLVRARFAPLLEQFRISPAADRALRECLTLCRREGIAVALLYMPESKTFRDWYSPRARARAGRYLGRVCREYGVPLIDARDWSPDGDFSDGFHLFPSGAAAFTARLGREVLPRFLRGELEPGG